MDVLELQIESKGRPAYRLHECPDKDIDVLSIFGGPKNVFGRMCADNGVASMPNQDKLAKVSYDILVMCIFRQL